MCSIDCHSLLEESSIFLLLHYSESLVFQKACWLRGTRVMKCYCHLLCSSTLLISSYWRKSLPPSSLGPPVTCFFQIEIRWCHFPCRNPSIHLHHPQRQSKLLTKGPLLHLCRRLSFPSNLSNSPDSVSTQGVCTCCSICLGLPSLWSFQGWFLLRFQIWHKCHLPRKASPGHLPK